jgi:Rieske 2Fe-2S family protein
MRPFPISREELARVTAPLEHARSLPPLAYWDEAVFEHEQRTIFDRAWIAVGREDDVAQPGQWLGAPLCPGGVIVVRGADLALRAFYNVCRHRGVPLLLGSSGRTQSIVCPYHGWSYELSGALREAPGAACDEAELGLAKVRVTVWQGFVFVSLSLEGDDARALEAAPPWLTAAPLSHATRAHRSEYEVAANWKLLVQNFQESLHFTRIHPGLERLTPNDAARSVLSSGPWLGGTMTFSPDVETVSSSGARGGRPFLAAPAHRAQVCDAMLFPTLLTSLQPDYLLTYRLYPLSPVRTSVVAETFFHPAAKDPRDVTDVVDFWAQVNEEDRAICERQQMGVRSPGCEAGRYTRVDDGVHAFDCKVARAYLS